MTWSSPRTWVTGEIVTAAYMNTEIRDNLTFLYGAPRMRLTNSAAITTTNNVSLNLPWDTERYDTANMFNAGVSNTTITTPIDGAWVMGCNISWALGTVGLLRQVTIYNATLSQNIVVQRNPPPASASASYIQFIETVNFLSSGTQVVATAVQDNGTSLNINKANNYSPEFWMQWVGA